MVHGQSRQQRAAASTAAATATLPESPAPFTLLTYNILSDALARRHPHLYGLADSHSAVRAVDWSHRGPRLARQLARALRPDLACLQEVEPVAFDSLLRPVLADAAGLRGAFYAKRPGPDAPDGCALFWNNSRFRAIHMEAVELTASGRANVGIVAVFEDTSVAAAAATTGPSDAGARFCVATAHLLFNPRRGLVKLAQLQALLARLHHARAAYHPGPFHAPAPVNQAATGDGDEGEQASRMQPDLASAGLLPAVLCGDLNLVPRSPLHGFLLEGAWPHPGLHALDEACLSGQAEAYAAAAAAARRPRPPATAEAGSASALLANLPTRFAPAVPDACPRSGRPYCSTHHRSAVEMVDVEFHPSFNHWLLILTPLPQTSNPFPFGSHTHSISQHILYTNSDPGDTQGADRDGLDGSDDSGASADSPAPAPRLRALAYLAPPTAADSAAAARSLPTSRHPSDHYPLMARFAFEPV
ncbi:Protein angel 1 [Cladochytrium tenue]|nr:Protein angel 1 [Cladochytrium tenue]